MSFYFIASHSIPCTYSMTVCSWLFFSSYNSQLVPLTGILDCVISPLKTLQLPNSLWINTAFLMLQRTLYAWLLLFLHPHQLGVSPLPSPGQVNSPPSSLKRWELTLIGCRTSFISAWHTLSLDHSISLSLTFFTHLFKWHYLLSCFLHKIPTLLHDTLDSLPCSLPY